VSCALVTAKAVPEGALGAACPGGFGIGKKSHPPDLDDRGGDLCLRQQSRCRTGRCGMPNSASDALPRNRLSRRCNRADRRRCRAQYRPELLSGLPLRFESGREGNIHFELARRRIDRELASALLPADRLQGQIPPGSRDTDLKHRSEFESTVTRLECGCRRQILREHRQLGLRAGEGEKYQDQGLLAGGRLAGRCDIQPARSHRFLQGQGRWISEPLGWPRWR
jgi:hypothetical protein